MHPGDKQQNTRNLNALVGDAADSAAFESLFTATFHELRSLAQSLMNRERGNHTLQPTALVNEAFLRLVDA